MNTNYAHRCTRRLTCSISSLLISAGAALLDSGSFAGTPDTSDAPEDLLLFIGLDVEVLHEQQLYPVLGARKNSAEIVVDGERQVLRTSELQHMRLLPAPKVSDTKVTVERLKSEPTYSAARDPGREWASRQSALVGEQQDRVTRAEAAVMTGAPVQGSSLLANRRAEMQSEAIRQLSNELVTAQGGVYSSDYYSHGVQGDLSKELYDALRVSFRVSAPEPITDAYAVMLFDVRVPADPTTPVRFSRLQELPEIGPAPRTVNVYQAGFPVGYALEACRVHLFRKGQELATTLSTNTAAVSRRDAFQFLLSQYLLNHQLDDQPASLVRELLPPDFGDQVPASTLQQIVHLTIDKDGALEKFSSDSPQPINEYVASVLRDARYYPALAQGEPVTGSLSVPLAEFVR